MTARNPHPDIPVACSLSQPEQQARHQLVTQTLFARIQERLELEDGYAYRFPGDQKLIEELTSFVTFERRCCPFFTFELIFEPEQGPITLSMRGPDGTKAFIQESFVQDRNP